MLARGKQMRKCSNIIIVQKRNLHTNNKFKFDYKVACKGKRCKWHANAVPDQCGEDSFFASEKVIAIADGVGGWNDNGVDPSVISRKMMLNVGELANGSLHYTPMELLSMAYDMVQQDKDVEAGSTTACVLEIVQDINNNPELVYSNVGDSGFTVFRQGKLVFKSSFQSIGLAPYQLAKIPKRFQESGSMDTKPNEADVGRFSLLEGDIIVLATDGVWDNFAQDLEPRNPFNPVSALRNIN